MKFTDNRWRQLPDSHQLRGFAENQIGPFVPIDFHACQFIREVFLHRQRTVQRQGAVRFPRKRAMPIRVADLRSSNPSDANRASASANRPANRSISRAGRGSSAANRQSPRAGSSRRRCAWRKIPDAGLTKNIRPARAPDRRFRVAPPSSLRRRQLFHSTAVGPIPRPVSSDTLPVNDSLGSNELATARVGISRPQIAQESAANDVGAGLVDHSIQNFKPIGQ